MIDNLEYVRVLEIALKRACDALSVSDQCVITHLDVDNAVEASKHCRMYKYCSDCWYYNLLNQASMDVGE